MTFGIIVLNGEPFTRYCLRALYPFAHEIIVVEGGHEDTRAVATATATPLTAPSMSLVASAQRRTRSRRSPIVTRDGFWPKKDELGRDRTPQSRAYAERATGDYLWQVDVDEFYRDDDIRRCWRCSRATLRSRRSRSASEPSGATRYEVDGWPLRRGADWVSPALQVGGGIPLRDSRTPHGRRPVGPRSARPELDQR